VACKGAGAGILKDIDKMVSMTKAIVEATSLPVTVKTRLGWDESTKNIEQVAERLQDIGIQALTIHGRTRVQMYKGSADWSLIAKVKENPRIQIPIFGNGDIDHPQKAIEYKNRYGVDGIMIGRASIGYPWIFREVKHLIEKGTMMDPPKMKERVDACKKHLEFSIRWKGPVLGILEMRRHYSNYFKGISNFKEDRMALVTSNNMDDILQLLDRIEDKYMHFF
jgi:nifR3 family TIM-barrel protein